MKTLYIVDDEPSMLELLKDMLDGYDIHTFSDGSDALTHYTGSGQKPDLVLTDLEMPNLNGLGLATGLRKNGYDGKIVLCTANATDSGIKYGGNNVGIKELVTVYEINAVFGKPFDVLKLMGKIEELLQD